MRRLMCLMSLGLAVSAAAPATAQPRPGASDTRALQAELQRLEAQLKELEQKLARSKQTGPAPTPAFGGGGIARGFGPGGPPAFARGFGAGGPPAFGRGFGGPGPQSRGFVPGGGGRGPSAGSSADFERRLDRIIEELEQLRRDVRSQRR